MRDFEETSDLNHALVLNHLKHLKQPVFLIYSFLNVDERLRAEASSSPSVSLSMNAEYTYLPSANNC